MRDPDRSCKLSAEALPGNNLGSRTKLGHNRGEVG